MSKQPSPAEALRQIANDDSLTIDARWRRDLRLLAIHALPAAERQEKDVAEMVEALEYIAKKALDGDMDLLEFVAKEALAKHKARQ